MRKIKFKIHEEKIVLSTNIFGKPAETETRYYIYRPIFFGLFRLYVAFTEDWNVCNRENHYKVRWYIVCYKPKRRATNLRTYKDAQERLDLMYSQPDLFIRM